MQATGQRDRLLGLWRECRGLEVARQGIEWDREIDMPPGRTEELARGRGALPSPQPHLAYVEWLAQQVHGVRAASAAS